MADEKIVTSIVANSDFSNLIADVQRVTNSLSKLQQEFAGANRSLAANIDATNAMFSETMRKTGQFSTHFVSLTSDVDKFGRNLDSGRLKLRDYFRVYQENVKTSGGLIRDLAKQQVQLENAVLQPLGRNAQGLMQYNVHIPRGLDVTRNKAAILKQELQIMNKVIQDGGVQLINWGKNTQWAGRQLTVGLTLPLAAFGKAAADAFKVADQELTRLTKVYGDVAGTSAADLAKVREDVAATAKELSSAMGVSFTETIGLAADIAATGKTGNELLASVSETTRLAVLGEVDRQEAMKATLAIQSAFKSNTDELAQSINFLNAVENQTSTTLNDLVEAIPKAGPVIKGLGGSVQDLALYLTAMREGGINASEGANALKSALASLINPTDVAVAKFKGFGIDLLGIVNNNAGDVTKTLFALQAALDTLDPLKKQQAIEQLFGKFQFSRLNALFENLGRQGSQTLQVLDLMKASTGDLEAVAARELTAVTESASGRYRRAVETLRAELAGVGDQFLNIGTSIFNVISKIIDFAQKLPEPVKQVLAFGGAFTAIIGPVIMLTGVLANFFGYIIKGLGHFKALFKGAEGFKLLTPEIMAAQAAASQMGDEFYSDAAATDTLRLAIQKLNEDLRMLQKNASMVKSEMSSMGQMISTVGGTPVGAMGGRRVVDPNHPMTGGYSRAAAHLNPRDPNNPSTIFGLTMQPIPLNRKIGKTPQVLMTERLPDVEGLTSVQGMSTGVVAGEHARYAALMATLGIQSKREIEQLKKTIAMGGQVSQEFIATFDDILPITQKLSANAAAQSAAIVAELKAGKINVEQARAAIISVNADLERSMGAQVGAYATSRGRTIDLTKAPLIDQPVVDPRGKPNLRGMFRQGIFAKVMSAVGRATGTRTLGAPYSIETTRPQGLNAGGQVYMSGGAMVPGPNVNADVVPAMLTPGEFVVNREATAANLPLLTAINNGYNNGGRVRFQRGHVGAQLPGNGLSPSMLAPKSGATSYVAQGIPIWMTANMNQRLRSGDTGLYGAQIYDEFNVALRNGRHPFEPLITAARASGMPGEEARILNVFDDMMNDLRGKDAGKLFQGGTANSFESHFDRKYVNRFGKDFQQLFRSYGTAYGARGSRSMVAQGAVHIDPKTGRMSGISGRGNPLARGIPTGVLGTYSGHGFGGSRARMSQNLSRAALTVLSRGRIRMNRGGMVPGYNLGGLIGSTLLGIGGSMAGQKVGEKFGGETGGIAGNILGFMLPSLLMGGRGRDMSSIGRRVGTSADSTFLSKSIVANTKLATSLGSTAAAGNKVTSTLARMALGFTRLNVGLGVATAAVIFGYKKLQEYRENQRLTQESFGLTEESAKKLGVSFTSYSQRIKDVMASTRALTERNKMLYESIASSGTPLNLTIEQYKKLRKEVKSTMQDQIAFINKTNDKTELSSFAVRLKEQLVAAGVSAEEASKKIYMAFSLSNKSSMAGKVTFGSADFQKIIDAQTAAASSLQTFNDAVDFGNAKSQANALNTALTAIDAGISEIIKKDQERVDKAGKGKVLTQYQAEKKLLDEISSKIGNQKKLSKELLDEMAKQNPEIRKFASEQDNVISLWQKMRIAAMGYTGDLSRLTIPQTNALYTMAQKISAAVAETNKTGVLKKQYADLEKLTAQQKKLLAQTRQQTVQEQINSKEAIKAIDKKIAAINKEAEARKKALQEESQDEDIALQIKQKQMEYQQRLSAGDLTGAAESQLELQRIVNEQQRVLGERAIEDKRARDVAPLEAQRQKLMDAEEALANKAALAAAELDKVNAKIVKQQGIIDSYNSAMSNYKLAVETGVKDLSGFSAALVKAAEAAGISSGEKGYVQTPGRRGRPSYRAKTPEELAEDLVNKFDTTNLTADKVYINAKEVFGQGQPGSAKNPIKPVKGSDAGVDVSKWQTPFGSIARKEAKAYAEKEGYKPGTYFTLTSGNKADNTYKEWNLKVDKDGSVILVSTNQPTQKKASGGLLRGPGTGTSDSILAGFSNGGMVKVSNGEYIINAATVSKLGVPFFDRLNGMKSGGLMLNYDMPKYANGGKLMYNDGGYAKSPTNNNALYNINVTLNGANMSPDDVANAIASKMQLREAMNGRARTIGG